MGGAARAAALLVLLLSLGICASAKRLVVFGDSISDNGNGTSKVVQAYFTSLLGSSVTSDYPPGPLYDNGRWSNGPTWPEYLADLVGYELHDQAVGSAVTNASISFRPVGDFYPSNLISNKRGTQNVTLPTFDDQIAGYLANNVVSPEDVLNVEIGVNDLLGFFEQNILETLAYVEAAAENSTTIPLYIIEGIVSNITGGLETLYAAGGRKFIVWELVAGELVPLVGTINGLVNKANDALNQVNKVTGRKITYKYLAPDAVKTYTRTFVDLANTAISELVSVFAAAHTDAQVVLFPFTDVQRNFVANYENLNFVNAVIGCTSVLTFTQYSLSNLYSLADPTLTNDAAKTTLQLSPWLVSKLNKLGADLYGLNGLDSVPGSTPEFLARLETILTSYLDSSNTLGHLTGAILTSYPLGKGGFSPYEVVPTCLLQAGDHLFHDEVHPTTRQHQLIAQAVQQAAGKLFS